MKNKKEFINNMTNENIDNDVYEDVIPMSKKELKKEYKRRKKEAKAMKKIKKNNIPPENNEEVKLDEFDKKEEKNTGTLEKGNRELKDLLAPSGFDRSNEDYMRVGDKYVKSMVVNGYPNLVSVGWLDTLYNSQSDLDLSFFIEPADERSALDEINRQITKEEAQYAHEVKSGSIKNLGKLDTRIKQLYEQRAKLEQNHEKLYHSCIAANIHADSLEDLNKEAYRLTHTLGARKVDIMPLYLRQDEGYKAALPLGTSHEIEDKYRTINSAGIVASFPFYNAEITHRNGTFIGLNQTTGTPLYIDYFDRSVLSNGNSTIFGSSGSGKSFFISLLTLRSSLQGISTCILDPEGEYVNLCNKAGGKYLTISPDSHKTTINPFDISEEYDPDLGKFIVRVNSKVSDLVSLIGVMVGGLDAEQRSVVSLILKELYEVDWGINKNPKSLYTTEETFNKKTGEFIHSGVRKEMPVLSDFYKKLKRYVNQNPQQNLKTLVNSLIIYTKGNAFDIYDNQTSENLRDLDKSHLIVFDVSQMENSSERAVTMYICLTWMWESWMKKTYGKKKRIICDEAWQMLDPSIAGSEHTGKFLNVMARRCRKRMGSLTVASQSFHEFVQNPEGLAVLMNSSVSMFLKTESMAIQAVQDTYRLSQGERNFLMNAKRGEVLIRMEGESCTGYITPFDFEKEMIENPFAGREKTAKKEDYYDEDDEDY